MSRYLITAVCLIFVFCVEASANQGQSVLVRPEKIGQFEFYNQFTVVAKCEFATSHDYFAKVNGTVNSVSARQGEYVSKDNTLITIDEDLANSIKSQGEAGFKFAEATYNRDASLLNKKFISHEALSKSRVSLEQARMDLAKSVNTYADMIIKAPFNCYVGVIRANVGDEIKIGDYLFSVITEGDKVFFLELPENLLGKIDADSIITVKDTDNNDVIGRIVSSTNYLSETGTVTVKAIFQSGAKLIHGSFVPLNLIYNKHKSLAIPEKAVLKNDKGNFIYKITEDNLVKQSYLSLGIRTGEMIEVLSGNLLDGDSIVIDGLTKVHDGMVVELIKD
jgi:RND family efflux transporter MFP subunit